MEMERAGRDQPAPPGPPAAGTLDDQGVPPGAGPDQAARRRPGNGRDPGRPAGAGSSRAGRLSRLARHPFTRHAALLLAYAAAGVAVTLPRASYLAGGLIPSNRDSASYVWGFWWVSHQLLHLGNPWFTTYMAAPAGIQIGFHTLMPLPGLVMTPVTLIFGPAASYNALVLLTPGLLCYAMYRVARLWLPSATGAVAAGAFFGLSSMLTQQAWYHLNIALGALFLPLALEASVRLRRSPGTRQAVILGAVMGAAVLTDQESAVLAAILTALTLVPWLLYRPSWAKVRPAALAVAAGALIGGLQIVAMIREVAVGGLTIGAHTLAVSYKQYGIGLPGMFAPGPRVSDFGLNVLAGPFLHSRDNEQMPMFGSVLTLLAVLGLVAAWRRRSAWKLGALWLGCAALALGTSLWIGKVQYLPLMSWWHQVRISNLMPYTWFIRIPGLSSFREADRLAILGMVPAALLAGAAVDWLRRHARPRAVLAGGLVIVAAAGLLEAGYSGAKWASGKPRIGTIETAYPALDGPIAADRSGSIVVDLPFGIRGGIPVYGLPFYPKALVMATADGHPRAIGYVSRLPIPAMKAMNAHPFYASLVRVQHGLPAGPARVAAARQDLLRLHVGWVVVWRRNPNVQASVLPFLRKVGLRYAYRVGSVLVYRPPPPQGASHG
ncbi:MAG: hypothetical protein ACM32E_11880 [Gemmatimonadota bacterium]